MARNIEIKARLESIEKMIPIVASLTGEVGEEIAQDDTFFRCDGGRLKLRRFSPDRGELIFYLRPDQQGPKESEYLISETTCPEELLNLLASAFGKIGSVTKTRLLYHVGRTRIHLDSVKGLGEFIEIEVLLDEYEPAGIGIDEAKQLMHSLGICDNCLITGSYFDLLNVI
jgi:predicted adenylyl cyclase CyaB